MIDKIILFVMIKVIIIMLILSILSNDKAKIKEITIDGKSYFLNLQGCLIKKK